MTSDIYSKGSIITDEQFAPFNRYIDVNGLRMFVLDKVKDEFVLDVANTFEAMFPQSSDTIDLASQQLILQSMSDYKHFQRIGYIGPPEDGEPASAPLSGDWEFAQDYIWEKPNSSTASQIGEVVEHLLHTISSLSLKYTFPEKWDWDDTSSDVYLAMQEAIDKGIYNVSSYSSLKSDPEGYNKIIVQEFVYWFVSAEWDYFEVMGLSVNGSWEGGSNEEWSLLTSQEVEEQLPLAHKLYVESFSKLVQKPSASKVTEWFSTDSSVADSIEDESSANKLDQQTYQESGQSIEILERSGTSYIDSLLNNGLGSPIKWVSDPFLNAEYSINGSTVISYSFPGLLGTTALFNYTDDVGEIVAIPFSAEQAAGTRLAFAKISEYINVTFVEVEEVGDAVGTIRLYINTITDEEGNYLDGIGATADIPSEESRGGDIVFNVTGKKSQFLTGLVELDVQSYTPTGDTVILYHEIFHTLGMEHIGDHETISFPEDKNSTEYTVMAPYAPEDKQLYFTDEKIYIVVATPMVYDIAALQYLYGANMTHNSGDTTYSFDPDTPFIKAIWDAGGNDTLDFSNFSKSNTISLEDGEYSTIGFDVDWSMTDNLGIAFDAIIENIIGGSGDDTIKGNNSNNNIDGGLGIDTVIYNDEYSNYSVTKDSAGSIKVNHSDTSSTTNEGIDTLSNIEKIQFTDQTIETSSINNIDDNIYSREGTFLGNKYTIKMLGDNQDEIYDQGNGNAFVVGRDVFSEEQVKGIMDNYEYVIKSIAKTLSWKGTLDFVVVVQGDTGHPTGLLPSMAFQHAEDSSGDAGVLLGTNENRVHVPTYEQLSGIDLNGDDPDLGFYINITENNEFKNFDNYVWIDPKPSPTSYSNLPEGQHDLISIITHEITHAMGVAGTLDAYWGVNHYSKSLIEKDGQYYYSSERITNLIGKDLYTEYEAGRSDDDALDHHVEDPEGGISGIASLMSGQMYSQRWSEPGPIEYAILYDSGWTERTTGKLSETINSDQNVLQAHSENTLSGTLNFNAGDNIIILDGQAKNYRGLSGDDTYFVSQLIPKNTKLSITDTDGVNIIQVPANTYVDKSLFTKNAARLTLEDGREITINSADKFSYNLGGNISDGTKGQDLTFSELAEIFGVYDILDSSGAQTGTISDLYII
ncbi:MAG: M10 family metallopeptidase [Pseudomonadota bacterium]|nr:M10 family metallopeptidase [Pseudomonadota bacterium]